MSYSEIQVAYPSDRGIVFTRIFDAPRELVWKVWTEVEHLKQWFAPKGFTTPVATLDFRPGGMFHYCMKAANGHEMWGRWIFREIAPPERIVWVNSFSDAAAGLTRPPFSDIWPPEMLSTATFTEHEGRTTVTVRWSALHATPAEQKTFDSSHDSMNQGWTGTFDHLAAYLAKI